MNMKRFLISFILIVFVTVGCAGPNKVKWTKPDFHQDQFKKDHEDCIEAVKGDPEENLTVEECLVQKGYESGSKPPSDKEKSKTVEVAKTAGKVILVTTAIAVGVAALVVLAAISVVL
jgi:hypothetical protein